MKIINDSSSDIYYQVTPSGTILIDSDVIASGTSKNPHPEEGALC